MTEAIKCDRCGYYTRDARRLHINGIAYVYDLCRDCIRELDAWMERQPVAGASERVTGSGEMSHDTREQLEADVRNVMTQWMFETGWTGNTAHGLHESVVMRWLDRQAAITEQECAWRWQQIAEDRDRAEMERDELAQRIQALEREIATLKEHRAGNLEKLHELTDECAELRKYRDEWKGLAEKYRADSIAAQEECERYRAKLGDVLDALHEAERAAR